MKFKSLEELVASIKQKRNKPAAKKSPAENAEARRIAELSARIEAELQWDPTKILLLTLRQQCTCGAEHRSVLGLFQESIHKRTRARRLKPPTDIRQIDRLPHDYEEMHESIGVCPECIITKGLAGALMGLTSPRCIQLPLFPHTIQRSQ